jgi:hypothetical protein
MSRGATPLLLVLALAAALPAAATNLVLRAPGPSYTMPVTRR